MENRVSIQRHGVKSNKFNTSAVAAVPQMACWWFGQLVHIERTTVANLDVNKPTTVVVGPMETHFAGDSPLSCCGMPTS